MRFFMPEMASTAQHNFSLWWRIDQTGSISETVLKITKLEGKNTKWERLYIVIHKYSQDKGHINI